MKEQTFLSKTSDCVIAIIFLSFLCIYNGRIKFDENLAIGLVSNLGPSALEATTSAKCTTALLKYQISTVDLYQVDQKCTSHMMFVWIID